MNSRRREAAEDVEMETAAERERTGAGLRITGNEARRRQVAANVRTLNDSLRHVQYVLGRPAVAARLVEYAPCFFACTT